MRLLVAALGAGVCLWMAACGGGQSAGTGDEAAFDAVFWPLDWATPSAVRRGPNYDPGGILTDFVYGAVYFRRTNPPPEDWERDYRTAAEDGHNIFRHWVLWGAVEQAPGVYDWSEYDPHMDLAAEHGIKVILGEMVTSAPEWAFHEWPEARLQHRDGTYDRSSMGSASVSGGFPGLSLNHPQVREAAGRFLAAMAERYKDHPALGGYDLANEMKFPQSPNDRQTHYDFGAATQAKFRSWLRDKYGDLDTLGRAWGRLSYTDWSQVEAPRDDGPYQEVLDWLEFRVADLHEQVQWRANVLRAIDPDHPVTAHAKAYALNRMAVGANNAFEGAKITELYGFTWDAPGKGLAGWYQMHAVDLIRGASRGQGFWHAEATGGPRWTSSRERNDGRVATPGDIRMQNLLSFAGGAQGILNPRWRPLLNGPLWGAYGFYGLDGSRTDRSAMASRIARWGRAMQARGLWAADPVPGDIGIVVVPETQLYLHAYGNAGFDEQVYPESIRGAYRGFFDAGIQADFVHIDDIDVYQVLYLPVPVLLNASSVAKVRQWVEGGGTLISEGAPGYLSDGGWAGETQPSQGFNEVFGVRERHVEFGANLHEGMRFQMGSQELPVGFAHQEYDATSGQVAGQYANGAAAVVDHRYGEGRTRLVGAFPGWAYYRDGSAAQQAFFADLLAWAGVEPATVFESGDSSAVVARVHQGPEGTFLYLVNHRRGRDQAVRVKLAERFGSFTAAETLWGDEVAGVDGGTVTATVPERDAVIVRLTR